MKANISNGVTIMTTHRHNIILLATVLAVTVIMSIPAYVSAAVSLQRISIACSKDLAPFHFLDDSGEPAGIMIDIWRLWSEKTGISVDFQVADWNETLTMVGSGTVDVHAGLFFNEERDKFLDYGSAFMKMDTHYFKHVAIPQITEIGDLAPYRVGVIEGDYVEGYLKERLPEGTVVPFSGYDAIMRALMLGALKVFAADTLPGLFYLEKNKLLSDFTFVSERPLYQNKLFFAVQEGNHALIDQINKGMALITDKEKRDINRRWIKSGGEEGKALIISIDRSYAPLTFVNALGRPSGLFVDIWRAWAQKVGRKIQFRASGWTETLDALRVGEVDIHSGLSFSKERAEWIDFSTQLYGTFTRVYHRASDKQPAAIVDYGSNIIGTQFGSYQDAEFRKAYPNVSVRSFSTNQKLIDALLKGELKAIVQEALFMEANLDRLGLRGDITARPEKLFSGTIHAGVSKGKTELLEQINDGFAAIDREKLMELEHRWVPNDEYHFYKDEKVSMGLSPDEVAWLGEHPVLRIAPDPDFVPIEFFDKQGKYQGLAADFLNLAADRLGVRLEPIQKKSWAEAIETFRSNEADLIVSSPTDDFRKEFLFTETFFGFYNAIITHDGIKGKIRLEDLSGKEVLVVKGWPEVHYLRDQYPDIKVVEVESTLDGLTKVFLKQYDYAFAYFPTASHLIQEHGLTGLRVAGTGGDISSGAVMVHKDAEMLQNLVDKALDSITEEERRSIQRRWIPGLLSFGSILAKRVELNKDERLWLAEHPVVRVAMDPEWAPVEFVDETGRFQGISMDYLAQLSKLLGIRFETDEGLTWQEAVAAVDGGKLDLFPSVARTLEREARYHFTNPYLSMPINIFAGGDVTYIGNIDTLEGKSVAVVKGYAIQEWLQNNHPGIKLLPVESVPAALKMVAAGQVYAFVGNVVTTSFYISKLRLNQIRVVGETPYKYNLCMAARKDWPILTGILQKALDAIPQNEQEAIFNRWVSVKYEHGLEMKTVLIWALPIAAGMVAILLFTIIWNRRMGKEITHRKAAEKRFVSLIEAAPDAMLIINQKGIISLVNSQTENLFGYDRNELLGKPIEFLIPDEKRASHEKVRTEYIKNPSVRTMGIGLELAGRNKKGLSFPVDINLSPIETDEGLVVVASVRDITERKKAEEALAAAEEHNRLVLKSVEEGIIGVDTQGKVTFSNPSSETILGFDHEELIGNSIHEMVQHSKSDGSPYEPSKSPIYSAYTKGISSHITDEVFWRKDGTRFFAEYRSAPIQKDGQVVGAVIIFSDITKRIEIEEELKQNIEGLERFSKLAVGREMAMVELKKEINEMLNQSGQNQKYKVVTDEQDKNPAEEHHRPVV